MSRKSVVLYKRGSNKEKCICCGQLKCHTHKQNEENDLVHLVLELLQFNELNTDPYMCGVTKQFVILIMNNEKWGLDLPTQFWLANRQYENRQEQFSQVGMN